MSRVLLDISPLSGPAAGRGIGRYVGELQRALTAGHELRTFQIAPRPGRLAELLELPARQAALRRPHDLFYAPTAYHAPAHSWRPWVCSILDVIPLDVRSHRRTGAKAWFFHRLAARAEVILTLSEFSKQRITELLSVPHERVIVAPLPVTSSVTPGGHLPPGLEPGRYALAMVDLATPDPRKRAVWLSGVAARLPVPLVVVGAGTERALAGTRGLGRVDDQTWGALLSHAGVFVYTSAYEGQGLPPLEAMAAGAPVVAMDNTAVHEVLYGAGRLVAETMPAAQAAAADHRANDGPVASLADACVEVLSDPALAARLRRDGLRRAHGFSIERFYQAVAIATELALS